MTDFFADLERQLVAATADRPRRVRRARARRRNAVLTTVLVAVLVAGLGLASALTGGDHAGAPAGTTPPATTPAPAPTVAAPSLPARAPGRYTVSVLNGTIVPGLARGVANRLQMDKYKIGNVTNAADQTRASTRVEYVPRRRADGLTVAKAIDVAPAAVQPAGAGTRAIAGAQASVIVIVGADQDAAPRH